MSKLSSIDRKTVKTILALAGPSMLEHALQAVVQYVDQAMVGRIGVQATAAVGLTTTCTWLVFSPLWAIGTGTLACIARALGAKDEYTARKATTQGLGLAIIMGLIMMVITEAIAPVLPGWLNANQEIRHDGSLYFAIICAPMLFRSLMVIMASALRASGDTRTPMLINTAMNVINIVLNYFLIFPTRTIELFGHEITMIGAGMGVIGAALATAISIVFSGVMMLSRVLRSSSISPKGMPIRADKGILTRIIRISLPVAFQNIVVHSGQVAYSAQVTALGQTALATHTLGITAEQAVYIPGYGMQAAAATLSGNAVGARDEAQLDRVSAFIIATSVVLMTITGTLLFIFPAQLMSIFTSDATVIAGGVRVLRIVACSEPLYGALIIFSGVFNGVGQTTFPFVVHSISMWIVRILGTYVCLNVFHLGLEAAWVCMIGDNITCAIAMGIRYFRGKWKRSLGFDEVSA
ncbi:MAG: MATE family efflux transporter [Clostridia bacterium]|nr:MATE family efflux transporter [Clostridia bacterium]